ncbi:hypothetical protein DdX_14345 [Ditylenchus destructor]|uniref:Secreted protein n=1 Tax=Ditylenchus destructor TaxID=166010 RepID=A0AAD4MSE1_9BILA|nr:hypothetical protein DdX_14345 [Ditylenchus destructor]
MWTTHTSLFAIFVLVIPTFSRILPSPIDDAIQPKHSQGPAKPAKNVKHHEHPDPHISPDQTLDDTDDNTDSMSCGCEEEDSPAVSSPGLDDDDESGSSDNESDESDFLDFFD